MEVSKRKVTADTLVGQEVMDAAIDYAANETGDMITGLSRTQLKAVRTSVSRSIARGETGEQAAARVKRIIGLDERSALALDNYEQSLRHRDLPESRVRRLVKEYERRLHNQRARLVAENEIARSIAEGRQRAWAQAQDDGLLSHSARRVRHSHRDEKTCEVCLKLDGTKTKLDQPTTVPSHPGCRCWETLEAGKLLPEHKFRGNQHVTVGKGDKVGHKFRGNQWKKVTSRAGLGWLKDTFKLNVDIPSEPIPAGYEEHDYTYKYFYGDMEWETFDQSDIFERWRAAYSDWSSWDGNWGMRMASASLMDQPLPAAIGNEYLDNAVSTALVTGKAPKDDPTWNPTGHHRIRAQGLVEEAAAALQEVFYSKKGGGTPYPIYRGIEVGEGDDVLGLKPGDEFVMPLSAFTPDRAMANDFTNHGAGGRPVVFRLPEGTFAASAPDGYEDEIKIDGEWVQAPVEYVTAGRFKVAGVHKERVQLPYLGGLTKEGDRLVIDLEQTGLFEPGFMGRWEDVSKAALVIPDWVWKYFTGSYGGSVSKLDGSFRFRNLIVSKKVWVPPHQSKGRPVKGYWRRGNPAGAIPDIPKFMKDKLDRSGGFTVHRMTGDEPKEGFSVALDPSKSLVLDPDLPDDKAEQMIMEWVTKNTRKKGPSFDDRKVFMGGWLDTDTGKTWLDVITVWPPNQRAAAMKAAKDANQIAIWDLAKGEEVKTGGTGLEKSGKPIMFLAPTAMDPRSFAREVIKLRKR